MKKTILRMTGFSVTAVFLCLCCDDGITRSRNNDGSVDAFLGVLLRTVTFNANGGSGTVPSAQTVSAGNSITLPSGGNLSRSGYAFGGWNTNSNGNGTNYSAGSSYTPTGNVTLYAKWNAVSTSTTYTVTFNSNGGSGTVPSAQTVSAGNSITLPSGSNLSRSGYAFGGWNTNSSGNGTNYSAGSSYTPTGNVTLYAKWNPVTQPTGETFVDGRDGKTYRKVRIGTQTWMAENLNYDVPNNTTDVCYSNNNANCATYGRLYNWSTAMGGASSSSSSPSRVQGVCPVGWHLPSDAEWTTLTSYVGSNAGTKLKSSTGWNSYSGVPVGTDNYGFSALPGGYGNSSGNFNDAGYNGYWWSATEYDASYAWSRYMYYNDGSVGRYNYGGKTGLFSVRCLQD